MNKSELIKKLREMTQAGIMDCKKALEAVAYDLEAAVKWLRENGISKAASKHANKIAAEGTTWAAADQHGAAIIELNSQTDFTGKSAPFLALADEIVHLILTNKVGDLASALALKTSHHNTVADACLDLSSKTGEKIQLRRMHYFALQANQSTGVYRHNNGKISAVVIFDQTATPAELKKVAMHLSAMNPKFLDESQVSPEWLQNEREILEKQLEQEGKPKEFAAKIIEGRIHKLLAETCLLSQEFFLEPKLTVGQFVDQLKVKAVAMLRYELGDGVEKVEVDFAKEVASQMR